MKAGGEGLCPAVFVKGEFARAFERRVARPGGQFIGGLIDAAFVRGGDQAAVAALEVQFEVFEGLLGVLGEGGGDLAGGRINVDPCRHLDQGARSLCHQVAGKERVVGVVGLLGQVEGCF